MFTIGKKTKYFRGIVALLTTVMLITVIAPGTAFAEGDDDATLTPITESDDVASLTPVAESDDDAPLAPFASEGETGVPDTGWYTANPSNLTFVINTADELAGLAQIVNGTASGIPQFGFSGRTIVLGGDIALSSYGNPENEDLAIAEIASEWNDGKGWVPIGTDDNPFEGVFDGANMTIAGLYIDMHPDDSLIREIGLFGVVVDGIMKNLDIEISEIAVVRDADTEHVSIGGVVGFASNIDILDVSAKGSINVIGYYAYDDLNITGGIAGQILDSRIENCHFTGDIEGDYYLGGVVGYISGSVENCYTTGTITGESQIGGVIGYIVGGDVRGCYSTGKVTGLSTSAGGVVGRIINGNVTDCYSKGDIDGRENHTGGVIGSIQGGNVTSCYSTGNIRGGYTLSVNAGRYVGGVVGSIVSGDMTACYSTGNVDGGTPPSTNAGRYVGGVAGSIITGNLVACYSTGSINGGRYVGGVAGFADGNSGDANIVDCAALNISVNGREGDAGRVVGLREGTTILSGNIASNDMAVIQEGNQKTLLEDTHDGIDGLSVTNEGLQFAPGFPAQFTMAPWTYEPGKLPGLGGNTVDMPQHLASMPIPDVVGLYIDAAIDTLQSAGFSVTQSDEYHATIEAGIVISQDPTGKALPGTAIGIVVSLGLPPPFEPGIPDTRWYTLNPYSQTYTIRSANELAGLAQIVNGTADGIPQFGFSGVAISLGSDIDLSCFGEGATGWNDGKGWVPIGTIGKPFQGAFDGGGYIADGLYINDSELSSAGLFGSVNCGSLKNLGVIGFVCGYDSIGGVVGDIIGRIDGVSFEGVGIENCYYTGAVSGRSTVGGVVGSVLYADITNCYSTGDVGSLSRAGGVLGYASGSNVTHCYSSGDVNGLGPVGGIVGYAGDCNVTHCYSTGDVSGENGSRYVGGIAARVFDSSFENCYSMGDIVGDWIVGGIAGGFFGGSIENCNSFGDVRGMVFVGGVVGDFEGDNIISCHSVGIVNGEGYNGGIAFSEENEGGYIGGVVGRFNGANIENCYSEGDISVDAAFKNSKVGGVAGHISSNGDYADGGNVTNCYSLGDISGEGNYVGGVVGEVGYKSNIKNSYSTGAVSGSDNVGGIVGELNGEGEVLDCAALNPSARASSAAAGRIAGGVDGTYTLSGNVAFDGIINKAGTAAWNNKGEANLDGADIDAAAINGDGTIGGRFADSPWTMENGKLPGLSGEAIAMPEHLRVTGGPLVFSAKVGPSEGVFAPALYGYGSVPTIIFTVENTGTGNVSGLAASLGGGGSGSFEIAGGLSAVALSPGQKATVGVRPKGELEAGAYTDTLYVVGSNGIGLSVPLSFTVDEPVFSFGTPQADEHLDFGATEAGYGEQVAQAFTVVNTGTGAISGLAATLGGADAGCFEISAVFSVSTLVPQETASVGVRPKMGLSAGDYTDAQLLIIGENGLGLSVALSFKVAPKDTGRGIAKGKDNFRFLDSRYDFFGDSKDMGYGFARGTYLELIADDQYRSALDLAVGSTQAGREALDQKLYNTGTNGEKTPTLWGGADFGMAAVAMLMKAGNLTPGFFNAGAGSLYSLERPKYHIKGEAKYGMNGEAIANLVTYYTLMQYTPRVKLALESALNNEKEDIYKGIVDKLESSDYPVMIGFDMLGGIGGRHVVVGDGIQFNDAESRYEISIWDPYSPDSPSNTLYISKGYGDGWFRVGSAGDEVKVYEGTYYQDTYQYNPCELKYALTVEEVEEDKEKNKDEQPFYPNIQEYLSLAADSGLSGLSGFGVLSPASATSETFLTTNYGDFTIVSSSGKNAVVVGGKAISGDLGMSEGYAAMENEGVTFLSFVVPSLAGVETYTLVPAGDINSGVFDTSLYYDSATDGFCARIIAGAEGEYVFRDDGGASVDFGGTVNAATIRLTRNDTVCDMYTASVSATDTGFSLEPSTDTDTIAIAHFERGSSGTTTVRLFGGYNSIVFDGVSTAQDFSIKEIDGEIVLVGMDDSPIDRGAIGYSVVFITKGGTSYETLANIAAGTAIESPGRPVKAGHTFGGWYLDAAFTEGCTFPLLITANTKIYAKWTANRYAVTYNANGGKFTRGSLAGEKTVKRVEVFGADYAVGLGMPERAGYRFLGWNTAKDVKKGNWAYRAGERPKASKATTLKNHTVYAIWQPKDGAVFLNENYGGAQDVYFSHIPHGKAYGVNGKLKKPAARPGFTFGGWYKKNAAGVLKTKVTDKTKMSGGGSVTLYAKWTAKKVTVTMNLNQKSVNPSKKNTKKTVSVKYGSFYAGLAIPALTGARFVKWTADPEGAVDLDASIEPAANAKGVFAVTVYAQYEALPGPQTAYMVRLDPNGGRASAASITAVYQKSPQLRYSGLASYDKNALNAPERDGYTFAGWYTAKKGGSKVTANTKVTKYKDHTLYARWKANKYWVAFDLGGGKVNGKSNVAHKRYAYGAKYKSLPTPTKTGHKFLGWYMDPGDLGSKVMKSTIVSDYAGWPVSGSDSSSSKASKASPTVTLTALFEPKAYKATFSANGGNFGVSAVKTMRLAETYGEAYSLPPTPVRADYVFIGWYTKKIGGKMIDEGKVTLKKATTLYAHWVKA